MILSARKKVSLLQVPFGLGAGRKGAQLGPAAILNAGLLEKMNELGIQVALEGEVSVSQKTIQPVPPLKYGDEVLELNRKLADRVADMDTDDAFPLVLGGDHSIAIGTLAGFASRRQNLGVLWIDAHSDLNTPDTTPSGNIHGMSLAVSLGNGHPLLTQIKSRVPKVKPEHVVLIGARSLDEGEKEYIRSAGITCYTMQQIDRLGINKVMEEAIAIVSNGTDGVHLSFDMDSVDPIEAPGTGTPVRGGLSYREANLALELLHDSGIVTSAEFVELNPQLDNDNRTALLAVDLIGSLFGEQIL